MSRCCGDRWLILLEAPRDLEVDGEPIRVYELLRDAKPVLLHLDSRPESFDSTPWSDRVKVIAAIADRTCELPLIGTVDVPPAVVIRPDGHVAWTGAATDPHLPDALTRWFGASAHQR
jgi:hypothetical protein